MLFNVHTKTLAVFKSLKKLMFFYLAKIKSHTVIKISIMGRDGG